MIVGSRYGNAAVHRNTVGVDGFDVSQVAEIIVGVFLRPSASIQSREPAFLEPCQVIVSVAIRSDSFDVASSVVAELAQVVSRGSAGREEYAVSGDSARSRHGVRIVC